MVADYRYHQLNLVRDNLSIVIYPIQWIVDAPVRFTAAFQNYTHSHRRLVQENERLQHEQLLQSARMEKFMALEAENERLRSLLKSSPRNGETLLVADIIRVDSDPLIQRVILDKGSKHGVTLGQTVIDAEGVIGEVIEVNPFVSRVILLTDTSYGIPIENVRNGVRGIAAGTGAVKNLELQYVPTTMDLKVGDTLVTSGLDGRYPPGYPVGVISQIEHPAGESFARVQITPSAHLEQTRQVLLVQRSKEQPDTELKTEQEVVDTDTSTDKESKDKNKTKDTEIGKDKDIEKNKTKDTVKNKPQDIGKNKNIEEESKSKNTERAS